VISVCIATYNGEKYFAEQLASILPQLDENDEIIISDDGSSDATLKIAREFGDNRIKTYRNPGARGYTRNFENALMNARGDLILLSDQDDVWCAGKVKAMSSALEDHDLVISDATYVNELLQVTEGSHFKLSRMRKGFFRQWAKPCYIGACMGFRREVLVFALPFPKRSAYCAHDYWLTLVGEACFRLGLVDQQLILFRRHETNTSPTARRSPNSLAKKLAIRAYSLTCLTLRMTRRLRAGSTC
jgi:glycosyltransferase involved in cell wall biosynthesis